MSRRGYPILGRVKLRISDAGITPLKPVYLRYRILEGGSQDQSRARRLGPETGPEAGPGSQYLSPEAGPGSQYLRS